MPSIQDESTSEAMKTLKGSSKIFGHVYLKKLLK